MMKNTMEDRIGKERIIVGGDLYVSKVLANDGATVFHGILRFVLNTLLQYLQYWNISYINSDMIRTID